MPRVEAKNMHPRANICWLLENFYNKLEKRIKSMVAYQKLNFCYWKSSRAYADADVHLTVANFMPYCKYEKSCWFDFFPSFFLILLQNLKMFYMLDTRFQCWFSYHIMPQCWGRTFQVLNISKRSKNCKRRIHLKVIIQTATSTINESKYDSNNIKRRKVKPK